MALSDKQIHKLGSRIRKAYCETGHVSDADLQLLQEYRLSYRDTIAKVFNILNKVAHGVDSKSIVTYRIKRISSIEEKLKRYPESPLNRLIDVAGCRCILHSSNQVYKVLKKLQAAAELEITNIKDYIKEPQPEGYRSLHVYVKVKNGDGKQVEIQLRDIEQHNWATLLEISDVILKTKLKEYNDPADLLEFHRILSHPDTEWSNEEKEHYFAMLKKYQYVDHLHEVFAQNITVRYDWLCSQGSAIRDYYLIEVGTDYRTSIKSYRTFKDAEDAYFETFAHDGNSNVVLTQIQNATYEQISMAYSNYVLSSHKFSNDCLDRYMLEIKTALENKDISSYKEFLDEYFNAAASQVIYFNQELNFLTSQTYPQKIQKSKIVEWERDTKSRIKQLNARKARLSSYYKDLSRWSWFYLQVAHFTKELGKKYDAKVRLNSMPIRMR